MSDARAANRSTRAVTVGHTAAGASTPSVHTPHAEPCSPGEDHMLEDSTIDVYCRSMQTRVVAGVLTLLSAAGCADTDAQEPAAQESLRAEIVIDPSKESDPSWQQCDAIYELRSHGEGKDSPYVVEPGGEYHPQILFDTPWGDEPAQVIAFKFLTDNAKVLHHWILYNGMTMVTGWAPGKAENPYPSDVGMELLPGKDGLRLDMHYYNTRGTKAELDRSGLAICVVKGAHRRKHTAAVHGGFSVRGADLLIPPNVKNHVLTRTCKFEGADPVTILRVSPHAHQHANYMKLAVKRADGRDEVVHEGPFNFEEQSGYDLRPGFELRNGDVVTASCTYDNETNRNITWGESTDQEMCFLWSVYYPKGALKCGAPAVRPATTPVAPAASP